MLSSESGLVETTLLLLLSEHDCVMLLLWQAVQSALHLQDTELLNLIPVHMLSTSFRLPLKHLNQRVSIRRDIPFWTALVVFIFTVRTYGDNTDRTR